MTVTLPQRYATCEGCGHRHLKPAFWIGKARITRCVHCPPKLDVPDLQSQLEDLLNEVWEDEQRERLQDRLDLMGGPNH